MQHNNLQVNFPRLKDTIMKSAEIGRIPNNGLGRLALSDEDKRIRDIFQKWMEEDQLETRVDDFGNMYGRREGVKNDLSPVLIGSHLDTQPQGGRFDGILGVLAGLEVIRTLSENNIKTTRSIEIVNFTNEEGARFEPPLLGSGGLTGVFDKNFVYSREDRNNLAFEKELEKIGYKGSEENRIKDIHSFIELHIEQGPILENRQKAIGVVEGIKGMAWLEFTVKGKGGHAGPTPMNLRKDALMAASEIITHIKKKSNQADTDISVTAGRLTLKPNVVNCIPEEVVFSLDVRHINDRKRVSFLKEILDDIEKIAMEENVEVLSETLWEVDTTYFNPAVIDQIMESTERLGHSYMNLYSGAGHDSKYINNIAPTGMIFLPSVNGISHVESELTYDKDIEAGANVLLQTLMRLANMEEAL